MFSEGIPKSFTIGSWRRCYQTSDGEARDLRSQTGAPSLVAWSSKSESTRGSSFIHPSPFQSRTNKVYIDCSKSLFREKNFPLKLRKHLTISIIIVTVFCPEESFSKEFQDTPFDNSWVLYPNGRRIRCDKITADRTLVHCASPMDQYPRTIREYLR